MNLDITSTLSISTLTFLVALIYSSVGHGGASGYLALLSLFSFPQEQMATSALCLNLLVTGIAFRIFSRKNYFSWSLTCPFLSTSIPAAFIGGLIQLPPSLYSKLLVAVLLFSAFRLMIHRKGPPQENAVNTPLFWCSLIVGGGIGLLSGMIGIGGGIFLSPLLIFFRWASPRETAATSAFFIFLNSAAGLLGRITRQNFEIHLSIPLTLMILSAFLGCLIGPRLGIRLSDQYLKKILAAVLLIAVLKLL